MPQVRVHASLVRRWWAGLLFWPSWLILWSIAPLFRDQARYDALVERCCELLVAVGWRSSITIEPVDPS